MTEFFAEQLKVTVACATRSSPKPNSQFNDLVGAGTALWQVSFGQAISGMYSRDSCRPRSINGMNQRIASPFRPHKAEGCRLLGIGRGTLV